MQSCEFYISFGISLAQNQWVLSWKAAVDSFHMQQYTDFSKNE